MHLHVEPRQLRRTHGKVPFNRRCLDCRDLATQVQRIIALGFNTIKIPFSFNDLYGLIPNNFTGDCEPLTAAQLQVSCLHRLRCKEHGLLRAACCRCTLL